MAASASGGAPLLNPAGFGQALDQPHPLPLLFHSPYDGAEDFCFSFGPISILASVAVRGFSASRSAPHHLLLSGLGGIFCLGSSMDASPTSDVS